MKSKKKVINKLYKDYGEVSPYLKGQPKDQMKSRVYKSRNIELESIKSNRETFYLRLLNGGDSKSCSHLMYIDIQDLLDIENVIQQWRGYEMFNQKPHKINNTMRIH
jgi:hypothetical protein